MSNKNKLFTISTALCLLLPSISFSGTIDTSNKPLRLYIGGQYKPSVSTFSNFSVKETNVVTKNLIALKKEAATTEIRAQGSYIVGIGRSDNFNIPYKAEFQDNFASFSGTIGYFFPEGPRIEIEASHEEFDVKNPGGYVIDDAFRYFALVRKMKEGPASFEPAIENTNVFHTVMRNDGLSISSVIINGCYDFSLGKLPVLPYICVGIGVNLIEFFDALHIKFAGQSKLGITYQLSDNVNLFADGYYYRVIGNNQFKNLNVLHVAELKDAPKVTSAVATLSISYFGGEIGARFVF
ncbi:P44/Msp2 family outer membrane protein [Ehrlichia sp. JZT12]